MKTNMVWQRLILLLFGSFIFGAAVADSYGDNGHGHSKKSSKQQMNISSIHVEWLATEKDAYDVPVLLDQPILLVTGQGFGDETRLQATLDGVSIEIDTDDAPNDGVFTFLLPIDFSSEAGVQTGDYRFKITRFKKEKKRRYSWYGWGYVQSGAPKVEAEAGVSLTLDDGSARMQIALAVESNARQAASEAEVFARSSRDNELTALVEAAVEASEADTTALTETAQQAQTTADIALATGDTALANAATAQFAADSALSSATTAQATANTALSNAADSQTTGNTAVANAATAQASANTALANAATAQATGDTALGNAAAAQSSADTALSNAATAQATGDTAISNAAAAQAVADTALSNAATAQATGDTAMTNAATAQSSAETALSNAATAQATGDTAISNAATAQFSADTALSNAATAQATSDTAMSNAATAQTTADTALSDAATALISVAAAQVSADTAQQAATSAQTTADTAMLNAASAAQTALSAVSNNQSNLAQIQQLETNLANAQAAAQTTANNAAAYGAETRTQVTAAQLSADTALTQISQIQLTPGPQGPAGERGIGVTAVTSTDNQDGTFQLHFNLTGGDVVSVTTPALTHPFDTGASLMLGGLSSDNFTTPRQVFLETQISWTVSGYQAPEVIAAHWGTRPGVYTETMDVTPISDNQYSASFNAPSQPGEIYLEVIMAESTGGNVSRSGDLTMTIIEAQPDAFGDGVDSNYDGFDGDKGKGIFVKADAAGSTGKYDDPVSLSQAIDIANSDNERNEIYLFTGEYELTQTVEIDQSLAMYGGFHTDDGTIWLHDDINGFVQAGNESVVNIDPPLETPNGFGHHIGIRSSATAEDVKLGWFTLNVLMDGASGATAQAGHSIFATHLSNSGSSNVYFMDVNTGAASAGQIGAPGTNGLAGANGSAGSIGDEDKEVPRIGGAGGSSAGGTINGGTGGTGGLYQNPPGASQSGSGPAGGAGGTAGVSWHNSPHLNFACEAGTAGQNGQNGGAGTVGAAIPQALAGATLDSGFYVPSIGGIGNTGTPGSGGGGGGGGGGQDSSFTCNDGTGNSGGGGGAGGLPGTGGAGGYGGGANIGFVRFGGSAGNLPQAQVNYNLGPVGIGGRGGNGGGGGNGGQGGFGQARDTDDVGAGGRGGYGGRGGRGGFGQQGPNGLQQNYIIAQ